MVSTHLFAVAYFHPQRLGFIVLCCIYHFYVVTSSFYVVLYCYKICAAEEHKYSRWFPLHSFSYRGLGFIIAKKKKN